MRQPVQKRTLQTRARLLEVARDLVARNGHEALRVEEVVIGAGVAKGTFFAHFRDKDALMEMLVGSELDRLLDEMAAAPAPHDVAGVIAALQPVHRFMTSERYVFDLILRYSGAAAIAEIGPVAHCFGKYLDIVTGWFGGPPFRDDIAADLLAEGVQAFAVQAMALTFCALHDDQPMDLRLRRYLDAWLGPAR